MLDENSLRLYAFAVGKNCWTLAEASIQLNLPSADIEQARQVLVEHHLLHLSSDGVSVTATPPDVAVATLVQADVQRVHDLEVDIARRRGDMLALLPLYRQMKSEASESSHIEVLDDGKMVTRYLAEASEDVMHEVLIAQPTPISSVERASSSNRKDIELLQRGVARKTLRCDKDRDHPPTLHMTRELEPYGAEHRTVPTLPLRVLIFDRTSALVSRPAFDQDYAAIVVHSKDLVASFAAVFDSIWDVATPFLTPGDQPSAHSAAPTLSAVQIGVLDAMALGLTDEAIAARVGISVRTCRRHIAAIFEHLGAESRFQAGAMASARGLLRPALLR